MSSRADAGRRHVLRLCSVFEVTAAAALERPDVDPVGGMQSHTGQLTRALDRRGLRQTVVTAFRPGAPPMERIGRHGIVHRVGHDVARGRQLYALAAPRLLRRIPEVDLVHAHLGEDLAVLPLAVMAARQRGVPLVVTVHCSLRHTLRPTGPRAAALRRVGGTIERWGLPHARAIVTLTGRLRDRLVVDGLPPGSIHVVPSGVDPAISRGGAPDRAIDRLPRPRIVFVGRLAAQKGVRTLLTALQYLETSAHTVVVGDGPERASLERLAEAVPEDRPVTFTGFVSHARVPAVLRAADVVVLPSVYEELGSVLLEASAVGAPVVASRTGGIPEVVEDGVTGLLATPGDPQDLARAIDRVLRDPAAARRRAAAGVARADRYAWPALAERTIAVYDGAWTGRELQAVDR